jgi:hypothetical protein
MRRAGFGSLVLLFLLPATADAASAPPPLLGKSVVVSWSEQRVQRAVGVLETHQRGVSFDLSVYISGNGRIFNRLAATVSGAPQRGAAGMRRGASDQIAGTADESGRANRVAHFEGNTLLVENAFKAGGARRIAIQFDGAYGTCTAQVINGRSAGATSAVQKSLITGGEIEVISVSTGAATCSVKDGNVFGE